MLTVLQASTVAYLLLASVVAVWAGRHLRARNVAYEARLAAACLRTFWIGLGLLAFVQASAILLAAAAEQGAAVVTAILVVNLAMNGLALGALAAYFAYMLTGSRAALQGVAALYGVITAWAAYDVWRAAPEAFVPTRWGMTVEYAAEPSAVTALLILLAFVLPALVGAVLFIVAGLRARSGATRSRGVLVGVALVVWFGTSIVLAIPGVDSNDWTHAAVLLAAAVGLAGVYVAYRPPAWAQRRWQLVPLATVTSAAPGPAERPLSTFEERARELI